MKHTIKWRLLRSICGALTLFIVLLALNSPVPAQEAVTLPSKWHHQLQPAGYYAALEKGASGDNFVELGYQNPASGQDIANTSNSLGMFKTVDLSNDLMNEYSVPNQLIPLLLVILALSVIAFFAYIIRTTLLNRYLKAEINERRAAEESVKQRTGELSRAYADLQSSQARLSKTTENAPCMLYQFLLRPDGSSSFPYTSAAIRVYFGVEPEAVLEDGSPITNLFHPDDVPGYQAAIEKAVAD